MAESLKNAKKTTESEPKEELAPVIEAGFLERMNWKDFFCYGAIWFVIFFAVLCVYRIGGIITEQRRQINDLIERLQRYENDNIDFQGNSDREKDSQKDTVEPLAAWVKANLPAKGIEERPEVAEVFNNLADMLDEGTLTGEKDAFSEGIAQLQPVATRSIWLPFLTKLTKKLYKEKLSAEELSAAFRTIAHAIYPQKKKDNASYLLLESVLKPLESADFFKKDEEPKPAPAEVKAEPPEDKTEKSCPTGNCPEPQKATQNQNSYYGGYNWRYF